MFVQAKYDLQRTYQKWFRWILCACIYVHCLSTVLFCWDVDRNSGSCTRHCIVQMYVTCPIAAYSMHQKRPAGVWGPTNSTRTHTHTKNCAVHCSESCGVVVACVLCAHISACEFPQECKNMLTGRYTGHVNTFKYYMHLYVTPHFALFCNTIDKKRTPTQKPGTCNHFERFACASNPFQFKFNEFHAATLPRFGKATASAQFATTTTCFLCGQATLTSITKKNTNKTKRPRYCVILHTDSIQFFERAQSHQKKRTDVVFWSVHNLRNPRREYIMSIAPAMRRCAVCRCGVL